MGALTATAPAEQHAVLVVAMLFALLRLRRERHRNLFGMKHFFRISPRMGTAMAGIPVVLFFLWAGGNWFKGFVALLALGALRELTVALKKSSDYGGAQIVGVVAYPALFFAVWWGVSTLWASAVMLALLIQTVIFYDSRARLSLASVSVTILATLYLALFALLPVLRDFQGGKWLWLTLFCVWGSDTLAYYGGRFLGKTRLTSLSPAKTVEGAICGFLGAVLVGFLFGVWGQTARGETMFLAAVVGVAAPLGDLIESFFKRELGVKDTGTLFPGHGGILDRCDSLLLAVFSVSLVLHIRWNLPW